MPDIDRNVEPKLVAQMLTFLDANHLLEAMNQDSYQSLYEGFVMLAKTYDVELSEAADADKKILMGDCAKEMFLRAGVIREKADGTFEIMKQQEYKDIVYSARYRYEQAKAARTMMELSAKIPVSKILDGFSKTGETISNALRQTAGFAKSQTAVDLAEAVISKTELSEKSAADLLSDAKDLADAAAKKAQQRLDFQNGLSTEYPGFDEVSNLITDKRVGDMARIASQDKKTDMLFNVTDEGFVRGLRNAKNMITTETLDLMQGILDFDKKVRPGAKEITADQISGSLKAELSSMKSTWMVSVVNFGKFMAGELAVTARQGFASRLLRLNTSQKKQNLTPRQKKAAAITMRALTVGDKIAKDIYNKVNSSDGMSKMHMEYIENRLKEASEGELADARQCGKEFAQIMSRQNLFRCGISENIPGWMRALNLSPEASAWAFAYLKEYARVTTDGVVWDSTDRETEVQRTFRRYIHAMPGGNRRQEQQFQAGLERLKGDFIQEHRRKVGEVARLRSEEGLPPLSYQSHFNKAYDNAEITPEYRYRVVGLTEFKDSGFSMEQAYRAEHLDGIVVQQNDAVTLLDQHEEDGISALIGDSGYAKRMQVNGEPTYHLSDNGKSKTIDSIEDAFVNLRKRDIKAHFKIPAEQSRIGDSLNPCLQNGYTARMEGNLVRLTDPDGVHSFLADGYDYDANGALPACLRNYCQTFRAELEGKLLRETGLSGLYVSMEQDRRRIMDSPMLGNLHHPYREKLAAVDRIVGDMRQMDTGTLLNRTARDAKFAECKREIEQVEPSGMERTRNNFYQKVKEIKNIRRNDPVLAICMLTGAECERQGDHVSVHTANGDQFVVSDERKVMPVRQSENTFIFAAKMQHVLDDPDVRQWAELGLDTGETRTETSVNLGMERNEPMERG